MRQFCDLETRSHPPDVPAKLINKTIRKVEFDKSRDTSDRYLGCFDNLTVYFLV